MKLLVSSLQSMDDLADVILRLFKWGEFVSEYWHFERTY